jgi:hypothetical protein
MNKAPIRNPKLTAMISPSSRAGWRRLKKDAANIMPIEKPKKESNVELEKSDLKRITVALKCSVNLSFMLSSL